MKTINVIVTSKEVVTHLYAYPSTGDGMLEAEEQFCKLAREQNIPEITITAALDDNWLVGPNEWSLNLVHNCNNED